MKKVFIKSAMAAVSAIAILGSSLSGVGITVWEPVEVKAEGSGINTYGTVEYGIRGGHLNIGGSGTVEADMFKDVDISQITSVSIDNGITAIGEAAFKGWSNLTEVSFYGEIKTIGDYAFSDCKKLYLKPDNFPSGLTEIGEGAFYNCSKISAHLRFPDSLEKIGKLAFFGCSIMEVTVPGSVTSIGQDAMGTYYDTYLQEIMPLKGFVIHGCYDTEAQRYANESKVGFMGELPDGDYSGKCSGYFGDIQYYYSAAKETLTISGTGDIPSDIVNGRDKSAIKKVVIKEGITGISNWLFEGWAYVESVELSSTVRYVGRAAFNSCDRLTSVVIPEGVTKIGERAFAGCAKLNSITVPSSVTDIGADALGMYYSRDCQDYIPYQNFAICGEKDSAAQKYAAENSIRFVDINNKDNVFLYDASTNGCYWYEGNVRQGTVSDPKAFTFEGTIRGREIYDPVSDGWYWLDADSDGAKAVSKEVFMPYIYQDELLWAEDKVWEVAKESGSLAQSIHDAIMAHQSNPDSRAGGKWVRYDENGKMYKGWYDADEKLYPSQAGNTYYYDYQTGFMAKGYVTIEGVEYHFDEVTGALVK